MKIKKKMMTISWISPRHPCLAKSLQFYFTDVVLEYFLQIYASSCEFDQRSVRGEGLDNGGWGYSPESIHYCMTFPQH